MLNDYLRQTRLNFEAVQDYEGYAGILAMHDDNTLYLREFDSNNEIIKVTPDHKIYVENYRQKIEINYEQAISVKSDLGDLLYLGKEVVIK